MISQVVLEFKTGNKSWSKTKDSVYLGVYGKNGGREFSLNVNGKSPFEKPNATVSLVLGENVSKSAGIQVDKSLDKGVNDPTLHPLHLHDVEFVYVRKHEGQSDRTDDWAEFSEIKVLLFNSVGKVLPFAKRGLVSLSKESGLKHWLLKDKNPVPEFEVVDERAYFETQKDFDFYMQQINDVDLEEVELNNEKIGFISFYELVNQTRKYDFDRIDLNNDVHIEIEDPFITHVLNYNLEVQIGNRVHRIEKDYSFSYEKGNYREVVKFNSQKSVTVSTTQLTQVNEFLSVVRHTNSNTASRGGVWVFGYGWRTHPDWKSFGHNKVMKATQWQTNLHFYKGMGVNVRYQEYRGWWIFKHWQDVKAEYLELSYQGNVKISRKVTAQGGNQIATVYYVPIGNFKNGSNKKFIGITIDESAMANVNPSANIPVSPGAADLMYEIENLNSTHKCVKFGRLETINLSWIW